MLGRLGAAARHGHLGRVTLSNLVRAIASATDSTGAERPCVRADFLEGSRERSHVCVRQVLREVSFDSISVVAPRAVERRGARFREDDENRAAIVFRTNSLNETRLLHPVDDSGEAALAVEDPVGERVHRDAVRRFLEVDEDVVPALRDARVLFELRIENVDKCHRALEEQPPAAQPLRRGA